jgi:general L-amino acid transport system permease protein
MDDKQYPVSIDLGIPESAAPPEPPPAGVMVWLRKNLFRSVGSGILSVGMILAILGAGWSIMSFAFEETRQWRAVAQNSRLLMVQAYPQDDFLRVWIAVGLILVIGALSLAVYGESGKTSWKRIGRSLTGFGLIIAIMLASPLVEGRSERYLTVVIALVIAAIGIGIPRMLGEERAKQDTISTPAVIGVLLGLVTVALWFIEAPIQGTNEAGNNVDEWVPIATSTRLPWSIILLLTIGAYPLGRRLKDAYPGLRRILTGWWILASPLLVLVVLRKPNIDWDLVVAFDLPVLIGGAIVGWLALQWMGAPGRGEEGRIVAGLLTVGSIILLFVPFPEAVSSPATIKWIILLLGAFALLSPTFGGSPAAVRSFQWVWVLTVFAVVFFFRLGGSETLLLRPGSTVPFAGGEFLGGLALTAVLAIFAIGLSFPIGVMLALGRSSTLPIFRTVSTAYIELIRSVPLITWLFAAINFGDFFLPEGLQSIDNVVRAIGAMTFFSAAYLAENVRGGLQSLSRGQYEAADALGMSVVQKTALITLPQALRAVIPALVGQVIALFKDTSLVAIIGLFDLLYIGKTVIPGQSAFLGSFMEAIIAVAIIYWPFAFAMSRASMRLEKKLGLGTR